MKIVTSLILGLCVIGSAATAQAGLVVESAITFTDNDDIAETTTFNVDIRAGIDAGGPLDVFGFSLQMNSSVAPVSVTALPVANTAGWRRSTFNYQPVSTGTTNPMVRIEANTTDNSSIPASEFIDFDVADAQALIGSFQFVFARTVGPDIPVTFNVSPITFTGSGDVPDTESGFVESVLPPGSLPGANPGFELIDTDYSTAATGIIGGLTAIPEPSGLAMVALGMVAVIRRRSR